MKYLLFDQEAISVLSSKSEYQSIEYPLGHELVQHFSGRLRSVVQHDLAIEYVDNGIIFSGRKQSNTNANALKIYCIDLTTCNILSEEDRPADLLTVLQKSFRTVIKIWSNQPFTSSERINGTKSILFPFVFPDRRRLVIERSNDVNRFATRGIVFPLLAYKYNAEEPPHGDEYASTKVLQEAGLKYREIYISLQKKFVDEESHARDDRHSIHAIANINTAKEFSSAEGDVFSYLSPEIQKSFLTYSQRRIVDFESDSTPLRIEGAAGTGKTASLVLRAYSLLESNKHKNESFRIIFFSHSESTKNRCQEMFERYPNSLNFFSDENPQSITFTTLLEYCRIFAKLSPTEIIDSNADDAKTFQLMLIQTVVENAFENGRIKTYRPLISNDLKELFTPESTPVTVLISMLQHEFAIQIKGRTGCLFDQYVELPSIPNGLPCKSKHDKQLIFSLFSDYQEQLRKLGGYDVDDVILEALARLNAPVWRRRRSDDGFDYIIVDEMHLFNINEQSVFHHLTRSYTQRTIPICFALDYSQAIGDRGDIQFDYIERTFGNGTTKQELNTVFRNSPQIAEFCAAIAASGTLIFQSAFHNPYSRTQSSFTVKEERKCAVPQLIMYENDDAMLASINGHLENMVKILQCKRHEIAIISFDTHYSNQQWAEDFKLQYEKEIKVLDRGGTIQNDCFVLTTPYDINGLEFAGVILLGVDEGRVPQNAGVSDISKHYLTYSAYNSLYLASSRAKYRLLLLGSKVNGTSSCLEYALNNKYLEEKN